MTRGNIFIMGKVAMQLGIEGPEQLEEMARFYHTYRHRASLAAGAVADAQAALRPFGSSWGFQ